MNKMDVAPMSILHPFTVARVEGIKMITTLLGLLLIIRVRLIMSRNILRLYRALTGHKFLLMLLPPKVVSSRHPYYVDISEANGRGVGWISILISFPGEIEWNGSYSVGSVAETSNL